MKKQGNFKIKQLRKYLAMSALPISLIACNGGTTCNSNAPAISISVESKVLTLGKVENVTITANSKAASLSPEVVLISAKNDTIMVDPYSSCKLSPENMECTFSIGAEEISSGVKITALTLESSIPAASTVISVVDNPTKFIFISESSPSGDMYSEVLPFNDFVTYPNGVSRADGICQANAVQFASDLSWADHPENSTWKAMLVDGENRIAAPFNSQKDWVLSPKTTYKDAVTGLVYGQTNTQAIFDSNGILVQFGSLRRSDRQEYWSGTGASWSNFDHLLLLWTGMDGNFELGQSNCSGWNSSANLDFGDFGISAFYRPTFDPTYLDEWEMSTFQYSYYQWAYLGHGAYCDDTDAPGSSAVRLVCVQQ